MIFFDVELAKAPDWKLLSEAEMAVGVAYSYGHYEVFYSKEEMVCYLQEAKMVVGFNSWKFDDKVIGFRSGFDVYHDLVNKTGIPYVTSLNNLCQTTLGEGKEAGFSGKEVPVQWQAGNRDKVIEYCKRDCKMLADVVAFGIRYGYVLVPPNKNQSVFGNMVLKIDTRDWREIDARVPYER